MSAGLPGNELAESVAKRELDVPTAAIVDALLAVAFELRTANLLAYSVAGDFITPDHIDERLGL